MRAAVLRSPGSLVQDPLRIECVDMPVPAEGEALLKVLACGVCRTDLHIAIGELPQRREWLIPGHQIVAEVLSSPSPKHRPGDRVGVSWIGGTDGTCRYCQDGRENLCDSPIYTGYTHQGGFAEYTTARADFLVPLPHGLSNVDAAPLLCAGIIGFRSLRVAEIKSGQQVGLFGFGSSAQLAIHVLQSWNCRVAVSTRGASHRKIAHDLGAAWVGAATEIPPFQLDAAVTFAPSGDVVIAALRSLRKGGIVAINAIHLDRIPQFDYDSLLWGERQIRSVANMTRRDGRDFLEIAERISLRPAVTSYRLDQANEALSSIQNDMTDSSAVLLPQT